MRPRIYLLLVETDGTLDKIVDCKSTSWGSDQPGVGTDFGLVTDGVQHLVMIGIVAFLFVQLMTKPLLCMLIEKIIS
jgi:hypothetical protein